MSFFSNQQINEIINRGWIMFDFKCKPTGRSATALYDKSNNLYFSVGNGWTETQPNLSLIKPFVENKKKYLRIAVMTDVFDEKSGTIYFFQSFLEEDADVESWEMCGFFIFTNEMPIPIVASYIIDGSYCRVADRKELLSKMFQGDELKEIKMVSEKFELISEMSNENMDTVLMSLRSINSLNNLSQKGKLANINTSLKFSTIIGTMHTIRDYLWTMETWLMGGDAVKLIKLLNKYNLYIATQQLIKCQGNIFIRSFEKMSIPEMLRLISKYDFVLTDIERGIGNRLTLTSLAKILKIIDTKNEHINILKAAKSDNDEYLNSRIDVLYKALLK